MNILCSFAVSQLVWVAEDEPPQGLARTMRSTLLKSIYVLLILRTLVTMGFPTSMNTDKRASLEQNSIIGDADANDASVQSYICVYIPPELENCNFPR